MMLPAGVLAADARSAVLAMAREHDVHAEPEGVGLDDIAHS